MACKRYKQHLCHSSRHAGPDGSQRSQLGFVRGSAVQHLAFSRLSRNAESRIAYVHLVTRSSVLSALSCARRCRALQRLPAAACSEGRRRHRCSSRPPGCLSRHGHCEWISDILWCCGHKLSIDLLLIFHLLHNDEAMVPLWPVVQSWCLTFSFSGTAWCSTLPLSVLGHYQSPSIAGALVLQPLTLPHPRSLCPIPPPRCC